MPPSKINLTDKFAKFTDQWSPKMLAELHGVALKAVKVQGPFHWHFHEAEDEVFWVMKGTLVIHFRDGDVTLNPGELLLIPHGIEHMPEAAEEVEIILIEPTATLNTGNVQTEKTVREIAQI